MGLLDRALERKSVDYTDKIPWLQRTTAGVIVDEQVALGLTAVWAAIRVISEDVATLPLFMFERLPRGKRRAPEHALHALLHDQPNPELTALQFREALTAHVLGWGNAYAYIIRDGTGRVRELWPLLPDRTRPERDPRTRELLYETLDPKTGSRWVLRPEQVLHLAGLGFDGLVGYSPIRLHAQAIGAGLAAEEFGARFFGQGTHLGGVISHPGTLSVAAHDRLKADLAEKFQGLGKTHLLIVLEEAMKFEKIGIPPDEAQFIESRKFSVEEVARIYRMPPHKIQHLEKATFCLPAGSQVFTVDGPVPIEQVKGGDRVWSYDGADIVESVIEAAGQSGREEILRIEARGAVLRCTPNHRVLVRRESLDLFAGGRGGTISKDGRRWRRSWKEIYVQASEIQVGDCLVTPASLPDGDGVSCPTREEVSMEFCELIGHHLGDGFISGTRGYDTTVGFSHGTDEDSRHYYASTLASCFASRSNRYGRVTVRERPVETKRRDPTTTVIYNTAAATELRACGVGGTAHTKQLPAWVFGLRRDLRQAVLRGYLDADGHINLHGRAGFCSVNRQMLEGFRHLALSCGYAVGRITRSSTRNTFGNQEHVLYRFHLRRREDTCDLGSHKASYVARMETNTGPRRPRCCTVFPYEAKQRALGWEGCYTPVVRIVREPAEEVYDLSVQGTRSFIADGVIVHNSNIEHQSIEYVRDTLRPWLVRWEQGIASKLLGPDRERFFAEHVVEGLLRGDVQTRYTAYHMALQDGWRSRNEVREIENLNPIEGGDVYLEPLNMAPAGSRSTVEPDGKKPVPVEVR